MLYDSFETEISREDLVTVFSNVSKPPFLLGGWAVYLTVNKDYKDTNGRNYHGSKDVDLGFHFSGKESRDELVNSALNQSTAALEKIGFGSSGYRMIQQRHRETRKILTLKEAKNTNSYDMFDLCVDFIVDRIPPNIHDVLNIAPVDEVLLEPVFTRDEYVKIEEFGIEILPKPDLLLATKLVSLPGRNAEHKKCKDMADIYAVLRYSGTRLDDPRSGALRVVPREIIRNLESIITDADYVAAAIDADAAEMRNVITAIMQK